MTSNLKQFNTTFKEFLTNLINIFPQTQGNILSHYRPLLEGGEYDPLEYCKDFMHRAAEYKKDIADKNEEIFHHSICLIPGIDLELIWNSEFNTPKTKKSIWIYLNVFWTLGSRIMEEEKIKQQKYENLSDEQKCLANLTEATQEYQSEKTNSKEQFLRSLTDRELITELERRKNNRAERKAEEDDEEDLLNFDPNQGYSLWNAIKGMTGGAGGDMLGNLGGLGNILETLSKTFNIDLSQLDLENFDVSNIGNFVKGFITPENMEKLSEQVTKFASEFQSDIDSGEIDKSELSNMFNMVKENIQSMASGEAVTPEKQKEMMEQMMASTQKMMGNMIPPHMRGQFEKMQKDLFNDPSKMAEMMANPQAMMDQMMAGNKGAQNRFKTATRNEQARSRLAKVHEERKRKRMEEEEAKKQAEQTPIVLSNGSPTSDIKKKKKNKKKKKSTATTTTVEKLEVEDLDASILDDLSELDDL